MDACDTESPPRPPPPPQPRAPSQRHKVHAGVAVRLTLPCARRTYYLGHSVKALTGRWQNNKVCAVNSSTWPSHARVMQLPTGGGQVGVSQMNDCTAQDVYWWTKGKGEDADAMQTELEAVKEREDELMAEVCLCAWCSRLQPP